MPCLTIRYTPPQTAPKNSAEINPGLRWTADIAYTSDFAKIKTWCEMLGLNCVNVTLYVYTDTRSCIFLLLLKVLIAKKC